MRTVVLFLLCFLASAFQAPFKHPQLSYLVAHAERKSRVVESADRETRALTLAAVLTSVLVMNRFVVPQELLNDSQSRSDLLAVAAIAGLVLNNIASLDVTSREAESIVLEGVRGRGLAPAVLKGNQACQILVSLAYSSVSDNS